MLVADKKRLSVLIEFISQNRSPIVNNVNNEKYRVTIKSEEIE